MSLKWHLKMKWRICHHGCQMAIAKFSDCRPFGLEGLWLRYTTLQNLPSTLAQSKERKGSKFAIWQPYPQLMRLDNMLVAEGIMGQAAVPPHAGVDETAIEHSGTRFNREYFGFRFGL